MIEWVPPILLLVGASLAIASLYHTWKLYRSIGEQMIIHIAVTFFYIAVSFLTAGVGIIFSADQSNDPIFLINTFTISLTYVQIVYIYRSLNPNRHPVVTDYLILLSAIAPAYVLALWLGAPFREEFAILSQIIPLALIAFLEYNLITQVRQTTPETREEHTIKKSLLTAFSGALVAHGIGISVLLTYLTLFLNGLGTSEDLIWRGEFNALDYFMLVVFVIIDLAFTLVLRQLIAIRKIEDSIDWGNYLNSIIR